MPPASTRGIYRWIPPRDYRRGSCRRAPTLRIHVDGCPCANGESEWRSLACISYADLNVCVKSRWHSAHCQHQMRINMCEHMKSVYILIRKLQGILHISRGRDDYNKKGGSSASSAEEPRFFAKALSPGRTASASSPSKCPPKAFEVNAQCQ